MTKRKRKTRDTDKLLKRIRKEFLTMGNDNGK